MGILEEGRNAIPTTTEKRMSTISPNTLLHDTSLRSQIMIAILKLEKHLSMGLGTLTLKDKQQAMMFLGIDMVLVLVVPNL